MKKVQVMILLVALATLAAANSMSIEEECPRVCPDLLRPVCATDGISFTQFDNLCEMQMANCQRSRSSLKKLVTTLMDWCSTEKVENLVQKLGDLDLTKPECFKPCAMIYAPVCVSNGKYRGIVGNKCEMELINCVLGTKATHLKVLGQDSC